MNNLALEGLFPWNIKPLGIHHVANGADQNRAFLDIPLSRLCALQLDAPALAIVQPGAFHPGDIAFEMRKNVESLGHMEHVFVQLFAVGEHMCEIGFRREGELVY